MGPTGFNPGLIPVFRSLRSLHPGLHSAVGFADWSSGFSVEAREENRSGIYSYEQRSAELPHLYRQVLKKNAAAWKFFEAQPPSYRKAANWWVLSAKKEETRLKRLNEVIEHSALGRWIPQFLRAKTKDA